ncbi:hypothetical protein KP509_39G030000 [Ceratopteris richardii]|uniref:Uncharacterized protein n=1 Tax=Ceratopteris richardii TaxID=49495 RepID=A0A8T2PZU1_CERRI|nr:hypothetical protein KP509_39G030000 [Ceratopteris richardii]
MEELLPFSSPPLKRTAYIFDGEGNFSSKAWDLEAWQGKQREDRDSRFSWYHVELPRSYTTLASAAQYLILTLCPPLKLQDILALASNGPFCGFVDEAIIFRANSSGPTTSEYTQKLAGRVTKNSMITVALGRIPGLEFSTSSPDSLLTEIPHLANTVRSAFPEHGGCVIQEHVLEFYLLRNHFEDDILTKLELHVDENEYELDQGGYKVKQQRLVDRLFSNMQLRLQRLLQVLSHGEQIVPRLKEKLDSRRWLIEQDAAAIETLVGRLQKQKENAGFLAARINALQAGLDTWQSEQINKRLYYISFSSIIFLPMSIVTSVFGMNVGGIPWTEQWTPQPTYGFRNVVLLCAAILLSILGFFSAGSIYNYARKLWSSDSIKRVTDRSFSWKLAQRNRQKPYDYIRL